MILADAAPYVSAQIAAKWGTTRKDALSLLLYAPVDDWLWSRLGSRTLADFLGVSQWRTRAIMAALVEARVLEHDAGAGRRPEGYRMRGALREWRVPWRIDPQLVEIRLLEGGWLVWAPTPVERAAKPAPNGLVERAAKPAHRKLLGARPSLPTTNSLERAPGRALYGAPLSLGASLTPDGSNSNSLSERERGEWSTNEASELAAAITARGNGSPDPRSALGPRVEQLARAMSVDETRRRLAGAPANYGPPMLVRWLENSEFSKSENSPKQETRPPAPSVYEPPPDVEPALDRSELLDRIRARKTNGDHAIMEV